MFFFIFSEVTGSLCSIGLFDTQLATMKIVESSPALCATCHFAVWAKDALECIVYVHIPRNQKPPFYENKTTSAGQACFRRLPKDELFCLHYSF